MKPVDFGQLVQRIDLELYAPDAEEEQRAALGAYKVYAWINPPPDIREMRVNIVSRYQKLGAKRQKAFEAKDVKEVERITDQIVKELGPQNDKLLSIMLSQHNDAEGEDTHWTPEEVRSYRDEGGTDPEFIDFISDEAWRLADQHLSNGQKKIRRRFKTLLKTATPPTRNSSQSSAPVTTNTS